MTAVKRFCIVVLLFLPFLLSAETIGKITITGNKKVSRETIFFYIKAREGALFSEERLRDDFNALWGTGFFADIRIETSAGTGADLKDVTITLVEQPLVSTVSYKTKKLKQEDIEQKLQTNNLLILPFSYYNPGKIKRAEKMIRDMLLEKGFGSGTVRIAETPAGDQVALQVIVDPGAKTRIGRIVFPGLDPKLVSAGFLRRGMKNNQTHGLLSTIGGKDVYNKEKIEEDLEEVRLRLQQRGFLEAKVGTPEISMINRSTIFGKVQKMMKLSIPVEMGPRYKMGKVSIAGNKVIKTEFLRAFVTLKEGKYYDIKKRNKIVQEMQKFYGSLGYFYCQVAPTENLDPEKKIADLTIMIQENEIAYLGKLEFIGNTFTKDHVIRREWFLREGNRLNINWLEDCIRRMKQLGLVTIEKMPDIKPDPKDPQKINITAEVKELNRQMINFNVGYSGYDGWFIALGYSTQNFLGMGESLTLNLQSGTRSHNYQFAFTEPYLFNLPASGGINVFKNSYTYPGLYTRDGQGVNFSTSWRFWKYWGSAVTLGYERINIRDVANDVPIDDPFSYFYYQPGKRSIASISPVIYYSTVDSPIFPTSGTKYLFSYRYSGGFLGGDVSLHRGLFEYIKFIPLRRHVFGFHASYEIIEPFGKNDIPFYERIYLGGERSIRGFDIYRISPRVDGVKIGGNKALYFNMEYSIPINENVWFVLFYDIGNTYNVGRNISLKDTYSSTGAELKIFIPMLNVPFRLIFAYNPRKFDKTEQNFVFRFAVGPSFN